MRRRTKPAAPRRGRVTSALVLALAGLGCARASYIELPLPEIAVAVSLEPRETIEARVDQVPIARDDRVEALAQMFRDVGCSGSRLELDFFSGSPTPNVVCTLPGRREKTIVVASHHVLARGGRGLFDAWTSVMLLPALYASLAQAEREYTFQFIGFASSISKGDASLAWLESEEGRHRNVAAMLWLDFLGLRDVTAWTERSDPNLFQDFVSAAAAVGVETGGMRLVGAGSIHDQSRAFRWYEIPTIYLHSLDRSNRRVLEDRRYDADLSRLDLDAYYRTYRVLAAYLAYLDESLAARGF